MVDPIILYTDEQLDIVLQHHRTRLADNPLLVERIRVLEEEQRRRTFDTIVSSSGSTEGAPRHQRRPWWVWFR